MTAPKRPRPPPDPPIPLDRWNRDLAARAPAWPDAEELQRRIDRSDPGTGLTRGRQRRG